MAFPAPTSTPTSTFGTRPTPPAETDPWALEVCHAPNVPDVTSCLLTQPPEAAENPSGSNPHNARVDVEVWSSRPWTTDNPVQPVSTSPQKTRDDAVTNGSLFDSRARGVAGNACLNSRGFHHEARAYNSVFTTSQRRSPQDPSYIEQISTFSQSRDPSLGPPPSRNSQGSPAFPDMYSGHTPSTSVSSTRMGPGHSSSLSAQSTNNRAFGLNRQIDEDVAAQFSRVTLDSMSAAPVSFQLNPSSQPWLSDASLSIMNGATLEQLPAMRRLSTDRASPPAGYRLEGSGNGRSYTPNTADPWVAKSSARGPRTVDADRRPLQPFNPNGAHFYPSYNNFTSPSPSPYYPALFDPYQTSNNRGFRNPLLPNCGMPSLGLGYPLGSMQPVRSPRGQDPERGMRSAVLEDFRTHNKSNRRFELKDIASHVVEFSGDQHGSRFIQQKLETANSDDKDMVFREIEPNAIQLMKDVFGNYVVQKFFEHGNQLQKKILADKMKGKVVDLSMQLYACRVVQKVPFIFLVLHFDPDVPPSLAVVY